MLGVFPGGGTDLNFRYSAPPKSENDTYIYV